MKKCALLLAWFFASQVCAADFRLKSTDVQLKERIGAAQVFNSFGCTGRNLSPQLSWSGVPAGTQSFALTVYDPDAPTGSGWWHWVVIDVPSTVRSLTTGSGSSMGEMLPKGSKQMRTDFGTKEYGGPCPPQGDKAHHYIFTLHALKLAKLDVPQDASAAYVGYMIHANELGKARITALYSR